MKQVLVVAPISKKFQQFLIEKNYELIFDTELITHNLQNTIGIITSNKLILTKTELEKYTHLQWIARLGSGMEIIDTHYCKQKNIHCFSSPKGIANAVAEHTLGMLLNLLHNITTSFNEVKNKQWIREANRGIELENLTVGIIGYGHTGMAMAKKLNAFTQKVVAYDKYKTNFTDEYVQEVSLQELQQQADIISFHVPLNTETQHYYNHDFLQQVAKNHYLINVSRGAVVATPTVLEGLATQKIIGACLDVLEEEKNIHEILVQKNNSIEKLLNHNVILTPHIAGYSHQAIEKMSDELMQQIQTIHEKLQN